MLALVFLPAGIMKLIRTTAQLAASGLGWVQDFPPTAVKLIGTAEVIGAAGVEIGGLIPALAWAAPTAGVGLSLLMVGAAVTRSRVTPPRTGIC
ncbi:DoxX family protein [Psychromicrobium xiongbiense]|uniref:DoxX family protein n=1 Tax=Psychromicrobium xiongbiense TaxID=3051184 RepID=UPI002554166D|nr:DoxX family protein [Psychromicrobium sp. YIM S02556]